MNAIFRTQAAFHLSSQFRFYSNRSSQCVWRICVDRLANSRIRDT